MAVVGRPPNPPTPKKMLKELLPIGDIFSEEEVGLYYQLVDIYMEDFDVEDLTSSDMDDILDLSKNRVLEFRLLKGGKDSVDKQLDTAAAIEKLGKKNKEIKENLSSRRKDRVNPNELKGFSIVDLAVAFNNDKKIQLKERMAKLKKEEEDAIARREAYVGNREDSLDVSEGEK